MDDRTGHPSDHEHGEQDGPRDPHEPVTRVQRNTSTLRRGRHDGCVPAASGAGADDVRLRLDAALQAAEIATWVFDVEHDRLFGDANLTRIFGIQFEQVGAPLATYLAMVHPDDCARVSAAIDDAIANGTLYEQEYRVGSAPERWVVARGRVERDASGRAVRMPGVLLDITQRRLAEQALRASEARYRSLFTSIDQAFAVVEVLFDETGTAVDHRFLETNPAFERQTGLRDAAGKTARELVPGIEQRWSELYGEVARSGEPAVFSNHAADLGRWFEGEVFHVDDPSLRRVAVLCRDVTASKQAEQARRESEDRFRNLADHAPSMIWTTRADGYCEYLNRPWFDFTGMTREAALGRGWTSAIHPDDAPRVHDAWQEASRTQSAFQVEFRLRRHDGVFRWCVDSASPRFAPDGAFLGYVGSLLDLTERKQAEDQARTSEARLRGIFSQTTAGIALSDLSGRFLEVNARYCQIVGRSAEELKGTRMQDITEPEDLPANRAQFEHLVEHGTPFYVEKRYVRPDGTHVWVSVSVSLVRDAIGRPSSVVAVVLDITERKHMEESQRQLAHEREVALRSERIARGEAERTSRVKDEFLATLSHELRTPLSAILGWAEIARRRAGDPAQVARGLEVIERNARAQTQIIEDLLEMSSIISGKVRLEVHRVDLPGIVRAAIETARPAAEAKNIKLVCAISSLTGACVRGDGNRLQQVLWNLLSNAVKFTPRGGRIEVTVGRAGASMEVAVRDDGEGITADFLPYVFDRFRQADASTTRRHGGLGLGLSIVKQLVELHGGTVRVASEGPGRGTTFVVALPLSTHAERAAESVQHELPSLPPPAPHEVPAIALHDLRVLVVDDEPDARALVRQVLEDAHACATTVETTEDAIAQLRTGRYDVLVSDVGMPGEDGYALIRRVRALRPDEGGTIPAIALTAYASSGDRIRAISAGFQLHVAKPVEPPELVVMVAGVAGRTGPGPRVRQHTQGAEKDRERATDSARCPVGRSKDRGERRT